MDLADVRILYSEEEIQQRVCELGAQISRDYQGKELVLVGLLKGAVMFMTDLSKRISVPLSMDFMIVSSYGNEKQTSGSVNIIKDLDSSIAGKDILIVEDIIDSGRTLKEVRRLLEARDAASVRICALLDKKARREVEVNAEYVGFPVGNQFILGYGLDYEQLYRNLPYVGYVELPN